MKKKLVCLFLVLTFVVTAGAAALVGCKDREEGDTVEVELIAPDGAPAIAIAEFASSAQEYRAESGKTYRFSARVVSPANLQAEAAKGIRLGVLPTNLAANLYQRGKNLKLLGSVTQGNLYLVGSEEVPALTDLVGKVVYNIGQGQVPDHVFQGILRAANIEYVASSDPVPGKVALAYVADATELNPMLLSGNAAYGILGEPAVTTVLGKGQNLSVLFSLEELYNQYTGTQNGFPQASLVIDGALADEAPDLLVWLKDRFKNAGTWAKEHPAEALAALKSAGSNSLNALNAAIVEKSNIAFSTGTGEKARVEDFLSRFPAAAIGGGMPAEAFYAL